MKTLAERLRAALEASGINQSELGRRIGVTRGAVSFWLTSQTASLTGENLVKVASTLGISPAWLATGRGKMKPSAGSDLSLEGNPNYPTIRRVMIKLSDDGMTYEMQERDHDGPVIFALKWYEWRAFNPELLLAISMPDASMEPGIYAEDVLVVNTADMAPRDGDVFALNLEGTVAVRRLFKQEGQWIAASDNPDKRLYRDRLIGSESGVIGKVVHKQSERI